MNTNNNDAFNIAALNADGTDNLVSKGISGNHSDMPPIVRKRVDMIKQIQTQHDELETKFFEEKAALEAKYQKLYQPLYAQRYDVVNGVVDVEESTPTDEKGVPDFWLKAMKNNDVLAEEISESDEEALKFLKDIKWSRGDNPKVFNLEFCFAVNPFFKNTVLTKTYQVIDEEDGPILEKAIGSEIEWFPGKSLTHKTVKKKPKKGSKNVKPITITEPCESFFNFFSPPRVPGEREDIDEDDAEDLQNLLEQDYDIGSTIRDEIIPHAVSWFTGETSGGEYDDMEEDEEEDVPDDEDEEDEEEDEEDDDDEDESKTKKKGRRAPAVDGQQDEKPPECKQQ